MLKRSTESSDNPRNKRSRQSRWEANEEKTSSIAPSTSPASLQDIVKKLSSVVKETSSNATNAAVKKPSQSALGIPIAGALVDSETAKAKALAQASLLSLNLPVTQVSSNDLAKRLYIGNLYYELKEEEVRVAFAPFGTIRSIDLTMEPGTNRSKGFCFLEYEDVLAAESAVQVLNGTQLSNRVIKVGRPLRGQTVPAAMQQNIGIEAIKNVKTKCIYIGGVRVELNSHHLESVFSPFGEIKACVMTTMSPLESGMHRGYGFIEFAQESCAENAIQHMNGFELAGQHLKVGKASPSAIPINLAMSMDKTVRDSSLASQFQSPALATATTGTTTTNGAPANGANATQQNTFSASTAASSGTVAGATEASLASEEDVKISFASRQELMHKLSRQSRCLVLLNLVGKGEVDDELEDEVKHECSTFGQVAKVVIKELGDHVRVFVVFASENEANKAKSALHGRFFAGNQVVAQFFELEKLEGGVFT